MNLYRWSETAPETRAKLLRRSEADIADVSAIVAPIIEAVRTQGDPALIRFARQFDNATIAPGALRASAEEFAMARARLAPEIKAAIETCAKNVRRFHELQFARVAQSWREEIQPGVWAGEQVSPLESVGIYVPRGKGSFPSTVYMMATTARVAGVPRIVICTPPTPDGRVDDAYLFAAELCGVTEVYKVGGAQAIAALAYGTESIPRVIKVVGPGNAYVSAARRLLADRIDAGMPAGPTDSLILADESADPHNTALDLLNEAEHGPDSASLLVTPCAELAEKVGALVPGMVETLPHPRNEYCRAVMAGYGGIVVTDSMNEAVAVCNQYAAEHLLLKVRNPEKLQPRLTTCGEILIGEWTPMTLGNFGVGVNHTLPTGGNARTWSATTVRDFLRVTTVAECTRKGFETLAGPTSTIAEYEGFAAHVRAVRERKRVN